MTYLFAKLQILIPKEIEQDHDLAEKIKKSQLSTRPEIIKYIKQLVESKYCEFFNVPLLGEKNRNLSDPDKEKQKIAYFFIKHIFIKMPSEGENPTDIVEFPSIQLKPNPNTLNEIVSAIKTKQPKDILKALTTVGSNQTTLLQCAALKQAYYFSLIPEPFSSIIQKTITTSSFHAIEATSLFRKIRRFFQKILAFFEGKKAFTSTTQFFIGRLNSAINNGDIKELEHYLFKLILDEEKANKTLRHILRAKTTTQKIKNIFKKQDPIGQILSDFNIQTKCLEQFSASVAKKITETVTNGKPEDIQNLLNKYGFNIKRTHHHHVTLEDATNIKKAFLGEKTLIKPIAKRLPPLPEPKKATRFEIRDTRTPRANQKTNLHR